MSRTGGSIQILKWPNAQLPALMKAAFGRREGAGGILDVYMSPQLSMKKVVGAVEEVGQKLEGFKVGVCACSCLYCAVSIVCCA